MQIKFNTLPMTVAIFQGHQTLSHQISHKRCVIRQKLLQRTNRKSYTGKTYCIDRPTLLVLNNSTKKCQLCWLRSEVSCHPVTGLALSALRFVPSFLQVLHFPPPATWSVIFQVLHFPALRFGPSFSRSCIVQVLHFQSPLIAIRCVCLFVGSLVGSFVNIIWGRISRKRLKTGVGCNGHESNGHVIDDVA